jgi:uncharacterized DUF497 family protein
LDSTSEFDWDEHSRRHIKKHGVEPGEAERALANDPLDLQAWFSGGGERFPSVGPANSGRWLFVAAAMRESKVRAVTAFDASRRSIEMYLKTKGRYE